MFNMGFNNSKLNLTSLVVCSTTTKCGVNREMNKFIRRLRATVLLLVRAFIEVCCGIDTVTEDRRWERPVATLQIAGHPLTMAFHSYDQHLVVANETDMISFVYLSISPKTHGLTAM